MGRTILQAVALSEHCSLVNQSVLPAVRDGRWRGQDSGCRAYNIGAKTDVFRVETDICNEMARRGMDGGMWKRKRRVNWGRSDR